MIVAFIPPYPFRGAPAPYLWIFYKLLDVVQERLTFVTGKSYLVSPAEFEAAKRHELDPRRLDALGYHIPAAEALTKHDFLFLREDFFEDALGRYHGNPLAFFKAFMTEEIPELREEFVALLSGVDDLEAVLSWSNCPSMKSAASQLGVPLIHLELGPLREPLYRPTAYLDFSGVNGHTEAKARYEALDPDIGFKSSLAQIQESIIVGELPAKVPARQHELGVVLQVEDDSNLLCYGNTFDNNSIVALALLTEPARDIGIRAHPGSRFALRADAIPVDRSASSVEFVRACGQVLTINSSVGLEALLFDVPVTVLGDASYAFVNECESGKERERRLAFYLYSYLVPYDLIFDVDYLRFRISQPGEAAIVKKHLDFYFGAEQIAHSVDGAETGVTSIGHDALTQIETRLNSFQELHAYVRGFTPPAQLRSRAAKIYFRSAGENFSEDRSISVSPVDTSDGFRNARFTLPVGIYPDVVRFDPADSDGIYVLESFRWLLAGPNTNTDQLTLIQLNDMATRLTSCGERLLSAPSQEPLRILSAGRDPFFEFSVQDLWQHAPDAFHRCVLEVSFATRDGSSDVIYLTAKLADRIESLSVESEGRLKRAEEIELELLRKQISELKLQIATANSDVSEQVTLPPVT